MFLNLVDLVPELPLTSQADKLSNTVVKVHVLVWPLWVRVISETLGQLIGFLLMFRAQLSKEFSPVGKIRKIDIPRPGGSSATLMVYI